MSSVVLLTLLVQISVDVTRQHRGRDLESGKGVGRGQLGFARVACALALPVLRG